MKTEYCISFSAEEMLLIVSALLAQGDFGAYQRLAAELVKIINSDSNDSA